jgi:arginyl-tRNA synthetase
MPGLLASVSALIQPAFDAVARGADPVLRASDRADLQINGVLPLAKRLGVAPRELAGRIVEHPALGGEMFAQVEVAGPGFINLTLSEAFLVSQLRGLGADERLGVPAAEPPVVAVVDYGSPNVAKEMHVGHLRSTIIGDALVRLLGHLGHRVVRENHVGDWGTPFGMLIEHLVDQGEHAGSRELAIGELNAFYQAARASFTSDPDFAERSRRRVVLLQSGDPETLRLWKILVDQSVVYFSAIFERLDVLLTPEDVVGESSYNHLLAGVVRDLGAAGLLRESNGAQCVFPPGFVNREGEPLPLIVQKSDGGYNYAASDLAAVRDRVDRLGAGLMLYVVGLPQAQHFEMVFAAARLAGWLPDTVTAVHVGFGSVLGADGKMFKTREGGTIKLADLIEEALLRAQTEIEARNPELDETERAQVARAVGIGALKYADLSTDRQRDYRFDWDRMLSLDGNTALYLQYAHARIRSILRRAGESVALAMDEQAGPADAAHGSLAHASLAEPGERALAKALLGYPDAIEATLEAWAPHKLCAYLYELAGIFTGFYEHCRVLDAPADIRATRLALCQLTARILERGLGLLGIAAPERM